MIYPTTNPGKRTCKYYKACGNAENCKRCKAYEKPSSSDKRVQYH